MEPIVRELCRNLSRYVSRAPSLKNFHIADVLKVNEDNVILESNEKAENAEEFKVDGNFKQALFKSAKTEKEKLYRGILFRSAEQPGMVYRPVEGKIVFRALLIGHEILMRYQELKQASVTANVIGINHGFLCIGHRPKVFDILDLRDEGFTHVVTVLGESEKARDIGREVERSGLVWIWLPLRSAKVPVKDNESIENIEAGLNRLLPLFSDPQSQCKVYLHCSAGIHRTGMITIALLSSLGYTEEKMMEVLMELREVTAMNVGEDRVRWVHSFVEECKMR